METRVLTVVELALATCSRAATGGDMRNVACNFMNDEYYFHCSLFGREGWRRGVPFGSEIKSGIVRKIQRMS
jgi:hypothetical protein